MLRLLPTAWPMHCCWGFSWWSGPPAVLLRLLLVNWLTCCTADVSPGSLASQPCLWGFFQWPGPSVMLLKLTPREENILFKIWKLKMGQELRTGYGDIPKGWKSKLGWAMIKNTFMWYYHNETHYFAQVIYTN